MNDIPLDLVGAWLVEDLSRVRQDMPDTKPSQRHRLRLTPTCPTPQQILITIISTTIKTTAIISAAAALSVLERAVT